MNKLFGELLSFLYFNNEVQRLDVVLTNTNIAISGSFGLAIFIKLITVNNQKV